MTTTDVGTGMLEAVERLRPLIEEHAPAAEANRHLSDEVHDALVDAGLFSMIAPVAYGGMELPIGEVMRVWEAVARIDSATAWNLVMNQTLAGLAAWLPADGAEELFADGPTTAAGAFFPPGAAVRVDGGWSVTAQVPFASGCAHAAWFLLTAIPMDGDTPVLDPTTGQPSPFGVLVPREEAEVLDTWHTVGMRGTGSADVAVTDVFVPDRRVMHPRPLADPAPGFEGPLYRLLPLSAVLGEAVVSVGIAAAAVDDLIRLVRTKTPAYNATPLREQQLAQHIAGKALARVNAARDTLHCAADAAWEQLATGDLLSTDSKIRLQLAVSFAAETCAEAVRLVGDVAGSSSIRLGQPFERHLRDIHVLTQHASKSTPRYATAGRLMFGLENDWIFLSF